MKREGRKAFCVCHTQCIKKNMPLSSDTTPHHAAYQRDHILFSEQTGSFELTLFLGGSGDSVTAGSRITSQKNMQNRVLLSVRDDGPLLRCRRNRSAARTSDHSPGKDLTVRRSEGNERWDQRQASCSQDDQRRDIARFHSEISFWKILLLSCNGHAYL